MTIATARAESIGSQVTVTGVVIAEAGRLGTPPLIAIEDTSAAIAIRLPDGTAAPGRGARVVVTGALADPYGQLEIRPQAAGFRVIGTGTLPAASPVDASSLGESTESLLVKVVGTVEARPSKATSGDITFHVHGAAGLVRIVADASSGLTADSVEVGAEYEVTGVAGQRASRKGALDGYRVWPRDAADLVRRSAVTTPTPEPTAGATPQPTATPTPAPSGSAGVISIADAIRRGDGDVTIEALVTAPADLLDTTGRRIVAEDRTAGIEILLPTDGAVPPVGARIRVSGEIGRAYDAPRLRASSVVVLAIGARPLPIGLSSAPTAAHEWRLVTASGVVTDVHKLGERWRAEVSVGGDLVVVNGLAGARIPAASIVEGRHATVIGIVRRRYPGASDRRWSIVPRGPDDVVIGDAAASGGGSGSSAAGSSASNGGAGGGQGGATGAGALPGTSGVPDVDLATLAEHVGQIVRVGGLVEELAADGFTLNDGTAIGRVALTGEAAEYLPLVEPGDALNATGRVEQSGGSLRVVVDDAAGLVRVGDPTIEAIATIGPDPGGIGQDNPAAASRLAGGLLGQVEPTVAGIAGIALLSGASLAVTVLHRRRVRRLLAARVRARLATIGGPSVAGPPG